MLGLLRVAIEPGWRWHK